MKRIASKAELVIIGLATFLPLAYIAFAGTSYSYPIPLQNITFEGAFTENTHTLSGTDAVLTALCYSQVNVTDGTTCTAADGSATLDAKMWANLSTEPIANITSIIVSAVVSSGTDACHLGLFNWTSGLIYDAIVVASCSTLTTLTYNISGSTNITYFVHPTVPIVSVIPHTAGGANNDLVVDSINITTSNNYAAPPPPADTCTPTDNQDWNVLCSDNCKLTRKTNSILKWNITGSSGFVEVDSSNLTFVNLTMQGCTLRLNGTYILARRLP